MSFFTFLTRAADLIKDLNAFTNIGFSGSALGADFTLDKLGSDPIDEPFISYPYTGTVDVIFAIDLGASVPWNQVVLINHNFDQATTTVTVKSGTTAGVADHTDTMTWRQFDMYFRTASTRTDRYLDVRIHDTNATSHSISIGRLMVGLATTLAHNFSYEWENLLGVLNNTKLSEVRSRGVNRIVEYEEFTFTFEEFTDAQLVTFAAFIRSLHGDAFYFFLIPDPAVYNGYVVRLTSEVRISHGRRNRTTPLVFTEESRGTLITA